MTEAPTLRVHGNAYSIFIVLLTIFSLALMVVDLLPISPETRVLVTLYDNVICVIFLVDFVDNLLGSKPKRAYFISARGWLDLIGSIPTLGFFPSAGLFRLARLSRLARITRNLRGSKRGALAKDLLANRGSYAAYISILSAGIVLTVSSILVLQFESGDPAGNIKSGGDALWWALATISTVGYGDVFPITLLGRTTGFFVMVAGVGIIGALASILASVLVPQSSPPPAAQPVSPRDAANVSTTTVPDALLVELVALREEIAALRASLHPETPTVR